MFAVKSSINIFALTGRKKGCFKKAERARKDARAPQPGMAALRVRLSAHDDGIRETVVNRSFVRIDQGISHAQAKERQ